MFPIPSSAIWNGVDVVTPPVLIMLAVPGESVARGASAMPKTGMLMSGAAGVALL
jgi:hypothetical protein